VSWEPLKYMMFGVELFQFLDDDEETTDCSSASGALMTRKTRRIRAEDLAKTRWAMSSEKQAVREVETELDRIGKIRR
jgi:hypothetical protein